MQKDSVFNYILSQDTLGGNEWAWGPWQGQNGKAGVIVFNGSGTNPAATLAETTITKTLDATTYNLRVSGQIFAISQASATSASALVALSSTADAITNAIASNAVTLGVTARLTGFNGTTWDRIRVFAGNADDVTAPTLGLAGAAAFNFLFDGTNFDRARSLVDSADAVATGTVGLTGTVARLTLYNGATYDRARTGSAANLSASNAPAPLLTTPAGEWSINHTPTSNTQATITRAAGATGVRHVCKSITATISGLSTAAADTTILVNLRDGATGAGTILWSTRLLIKVSDTTGVAISGLNIVGSAATAMTLEFSAAGGANTFEAVALSGFDAI